MVAADLGSNLEHFFNAAGEFFAHLSDINWAPFAFALGFLAAMQLTRAWAWRNVLHAAYPDSRISFRRSAPPISPEPGSTRSSPPGPGT
jgi:hypothetical protein